MPHVVDAMPALVKLNNCATNLDLVTIHGVDAEKLRAFRRIDMLEGSYEQFLREQGAALVGREIAQRRGWQVGQAALINGFNFTIRGVYADGGSTYESLVLTHVGYLQQAMGIGAGGWTTQLYVKIDDPRNAEAVSNAIDEYFAVDAIRTDTKPERAFLAKALTEFAEIVKFSRLLGLIAVAIMLVLIGNTIYMSVQDRVQETAVLRTLGFTPQRVMALVVAESVLVSLAGGSLGAGAAYAALTANNYGVGIEGYQVAFTAQAPVFVSAALAAAGVGLLGGLIPAGFAASRNIVEGLRAV